jgi:hypothetical protein
MIYSSSARPRMSAGGSVLVGSVVMTTSSIS